jgi:hypothetical protein
MAGPTTTDTVETFLARFKQVLGLGIPIKI